MVTPPGHGAPLESILEKAEAGQSLSEAEIGYLLSLSEGHEKEALFAAARRVRARFTDDRVFLYGFVYLSTFCRNDCHFCFYRKSNRDAVRYRKTPSQVLEAAAILAESGVHLIDLTMGEDPAVFHRGGFRERTISDVPRFQERAISDPLGVQERASHSDGFENLTRLVASVREATGLPLMVSPGVVDREVLTMLKEAGASWYACYQETHDRALFRQLRPGQDFDRRRNAKRLARGLGLLTEEGMLAGVGESSTAIIRTLRGMAELETEQVRVMGFVPQRGTPFWGRPPPDPDGEVKIIAILRLLFPDRLIPASLDVSGLGGLRERLEAGANVVTSLVPPGQGLSGVAQSTLDIDDAHRTVVAVEPVIGECGLTLASSADYRRWIEKRMEKSVERMERSDPVDRRGKRDRAAGA